MVLTRLPLTKNFLQRVKSLPNTKRCKIALPVLPKRRLRIRGLQVAPFRGERRVQAPAGIQDHAPARSGSRPPLLPSALPAPYPGPRGRADRPPPNPGRRGRARGRGGAMRGGAGRGGAGTPAAPALRRRRAALEGAARCTASAAPALSASCPKRRPSPRRRDGGGQRVRGQPAEPGAGRPGHVRDRRGQ